MSAVRKFVLTTTQGLASLERQLQRLDYNLVRPNFNQGGTVCTVSRSDGQLLRHRLRIIIPASVDDELHDHLFSRVEQLTDLYRGRTPQEEQSHASNA